MELRQILTLQTIRSGDFVRFFIYLFVAFLPFQIKTLLFTPEYYSSGFFNPYLSQYISINDILFVFVCLSWGIYLIFSKRKSFGFKNFNFTLMLPVVLFLGFYILSISNSVDKVNSIVYILRFVEFFIIYLFVSSGFIDVKRFLYFFIFPVCISAFIGILQYGLGHSVGLHFLGESIVSSSTVGVAKINLFSGDMLRAYGTFPHPNVLAGYLVFAMFFTAYLFSKAKNEMKLILGFVLGIDFLAFVLTFSRSAFFALFIGIFFYYMFSKEKVPYKKIFLFILVIGSLLVALNLNKALIDRLFFFGSESFVERNMFFNVSTNMLKDNYFGVGAGDFTLVMQNYIPSKLEPWQYQPVHNIFMLVANEIGIVGGVVFLLMSIYVIFYLMQSLDSKDFLSNRKFLAILLALGSSIFVIGIFDHYFISLYQGQALLWIYLALVSSRKFGLNLTALR